MASPREPEREELLRRIARLEARLDVAQHPAIRAGREYKSRMRIGGWPLVHIASGFDPLTGKPLVARGIIAVGNVAVGVLAVGGAALGGLAIGGFALGLIGFGGVAVGVVASFGGLSIGALAVGGIAVGGVVVGGLAVGYYGLGGMAVVAHSLVDFVNHPACPEAVRRLIEALAVPAHG